MMQESSSVPPPPPVPPVAEPAPPRFRAGDAWGPAAIQGLIAAVILLVAAEIVALILYAVSGSSRPSVLMTSRIGVVIFTLFHHVGMVFDAPNVTISEPALGALLPPGAGFSLTVAAALMGGTLAVGAVLYRAGRIVGRAVPGPAWARGLHGAKIAITYTVVAAVAGLAIHFAVHFPASPRVSGSFSIHPSTIASIIWPLALAIGFGFAGGFRAAPPQDEPETMTRARAVVFGGWRMLLAGLALSFVGLLVLAAVKPGARPIAYNIPTSSGSDAVGGTVFTVLTVPNRAALALFPSMGSCLGVFANVQGADVSYCAVSYQHFPSRSALGAIGPALAGGASGIPALPAAPRAYLLFLLVPAAATVLGGMAAARRAKAPDRRVGAAVGALSGVAFALFLLTVGILASLSLRFAAHAQVGGISFVFRLGPDLVIGTLLGLAWGVAGGAIGGIIRPGVPASVPEGGSSFGFEAAPTLPAPPPEP
ncbi:MAG: hypothetical protein E6J75_04300 [Deltaproteobacteria bacterium]|nr:MAG: hypothetical protein E6J75_04300 [Deltaproteobacteria bacterium]